MKIKLLCLTVLSVCSVASAFAQTDQQMLEKIKAEGLTRSKVMETAFYLSDVAGPRLVGSPGLKRAQDWSMDQFKKLGLKNIKREPWGKFGKGWEIQKNYAAITAPYYHAIIAIPKAWTAGTDGLIKESVIMIKADSVPDLEKYKGKLKGKIVILDESPNGERNFKPAASRITDEELNKMAAAVAPPEDNAEPRVLTEKDAPWLFAMFKAQAFRRDISSFFKAENAALILRQAGGSDGTVFTTDGASYADTAAVTAPELECSGEDYQRILRLAKAGINVQLEADIKTRFFNKDLQGYNIIGEIPGEDPKLKDQLVVIGGHLDSWHAATGATDNAAGSAVMMEVMRILKHVNFKPRRTIRLILWSAEEEGDRGSRKYVLEHYGDRETMKLKPEHATVSAYYNLDNGSGKIRGIYSQGNTAANELFKQWLKPLNDLGATTATVKATGQTDHESFDNIGIPGFQFIQDALDYGSRTHHSNQDTFDKLSEDDLKQAATVVAWFVYKTSQRDEMLPRKKLPVTYKK